MPTLMQVVEGAGDAVPFTKVRVLLRNEDGSIAKDTMVDFPSDADSVSLALQIPIPITAPDSGLKLSLSMAYVNASGDTVFRGGPNSIIARPVGSSGADVPVVIPVTYDGVGKDAARVTIAPKTGTGVAGTTRAFAGTAFDAQNAPIANTPFVFFTLDSTRAQVNGATGVATWLPVRGLARIVAALPNGNRADTATFLISLPASKLVLGSGDAQTGAVNAPLADSIVLRTLASDDVPVAGVIVNFAVATGGGTLVSSVDTSDANGNVSTRWTLGAALGAQTITATAAGLTGSPFTVSATGVAGEASRLDITAQPSTATAGTAFTPAIVVQARDAFGNPATNFTGNVSIAITGATPPPLGGTLVRAAVGGVATFNDLSINLVGGYTLAVTSDALTPDTTASIGITPAAAAVLEFVSQPAGAVAGAAFVPPVTVRARDAFGNVDTAFTGTVALSLVNAGSAILGGSTPEAAVNGLATFSSLFVNLVGSTYSLLANSGALTPDTSSVFGITPSAPTQIALISGGAQTGVVGEALAQPIVVEVRDAQGNLVPGATVDFSIVTGGGTAVPPNAATNASGQASTAWTLGSALGAQELRASLAVAPAVFVAVPATATPGAPAQVVITQAPTAAVAGTAFAPSVIAEVRDASGNVVTSFGGDVTLTLGSAPPTGALFGTTTVTAVNGVATFGAITAQRSGAGYTLVATAAGFSSPPSAAFEVTPSAPAQFGIVDGNNQTGVAGGAFPSPLRVYVRDQFGNPIAGAVTTWNAQGVVTLAQTTVLSDASGVAANTATMGATPGVQSTGPSVTTPSVDTTVIFAHTVTAGAAAQVVITQAPTAGVAGTALPPLVAEVRDALGNLVPTYTGLVVATLSTNPTSTVLGGTLSVNAVAGVATFNNLIVNSASAGYRLRTRMDVEGYESSESAAFDVAPAAPATIAFVSGQVQAGAAGTLMPDSIIVEVRDAFNNAVAGQPVTFAPLAGASSVSQTAVVTDAQGRAAIRANFGNTVGNPLPGVRATTPGVATVLETTVSITAAAGTQLAVTTAPFTSVVAGVPFSITAQVRDAFGNADLVFTDSVSIAIQSGPVGATLSGSTRLPAVAGIREFAALSLDLAGSYELVVSATGLTSANTFSFTVTPADPASVTLVSGDAQSGAVNTTLPLPLVVEVRDVFNNPVPGASVLWNVTTSAATLGSGEVSTDANGRASTTLQLSTVPGPAVVNASVLALTPVVFNATAVAGAAVTPVELVAPAGAAAGTALGSFSYAVQDQFGNIATGYTGVATLTLQEASAGQPAPVIVSGDTALVVNGVATWNALIIASAGQYEIVADFGPTLGTFVSNPITITPSAPSALTLDAGDAQSAAAGTALPTPLSVRLADVYDNSIAAATIEWSVVAGTVTLSAPTSVTDAAGLATNTVLLGGAAGAFSVRAVNVAANDTVIFTGSITAGAPISILLTAQPSSMTAGAADGTFTVTALDAFGNVATDFTGPVTVEVATGPRSIFAAGTLSAAATLGAVTFSDLILTTSGGYELRFFTAFDTVVTDPVVITAAAAAALDVSIEPSNTAAGDGVGAIQVVALDAFGNSATTAGDSVFVSILTGPGGNPLTGTLRRAMSTGTVDFNDLGLTTAGDYSLQFDAAGLTTDTTQTFTVSPNTATTMLLTSGDAQTAVVLATVDSLVVRVEDAYGNGVGGQTVSWSVTGGSATLSAATSVSASNGEAWIFPTMGSIPEVNTFAATVVGLTNSPISFSATAVAGAPVRLIIQGTVPGATAGVLDPITVAALDAQGNVALPFTGEVRARIVTGPVGASIFGDSVLTATAGTVTFSALQALIAGPYTLEFVSAGLAPDTSNAFSITPDVATNLNLISGNAQVDTVYSTSDTLIVRVTDQYGNGIDGAAVSWNLAVGGGVLALQQTEADVEGYARALVTHGGTPDVITVEASSGTLIGSPVSFTLTVEPGAAAQLAVVTQPVGTTAAATLAAIEVEVRDAFGNRATTFADSVTVSFEQAPSTPTLNGTTRVAAVAGVATFGDLSLTRSGTYRFRFATGAPVADATSDTFVVTAGAAALVQAGRGDAQSVGLFTTADTLGAQVIDASGNPVSGATVEWNVPAGIDSLGATTITDVDGYAYLVVRSDSLAGDFTPTATSAGLTGSPVNFTLTVLAGPAHMLRVVSAPDTVQSLIAGPDWIVEVTDSVGNRITSATNNVTVSVNDGPASFTGTVTVAAVAGVATFSDLQFSTAGNYTMEFASAPLLAVTRSTAVTAGAAFAINIFAGAGQAAYATLPLESPVQVRVTDAAGNPVAGDSVVWSVLAGSGGGLLNGVEVDTVVTDANGVSGVSFTPGSTVGGQTLRAIASNTSAADIGFTVQALIGNRIWTGATSSDWLDGANWYGGTVPLASDSVLIPGGLTNNPALGSNVLISKLVVELGAGMAVGDNVLQVSGDLLAPQLTTFSVGGGGSIQAVGGGTHSIIGNFPVLRITTGTYNVTPQLGDQLFVLGPLFVDANGLLVLSAGDTVVMNGDLITAGGGRVQQAAGSLLSTQGLAEFGGGVSELSGGVLQVSGDFRTINAEPAAFRAAAAHETQIRGRNRTISLANPDVSIDTSCTASCFGRLVVRSDQGADTVTFLSSVKARAGFNVDTRQIWADTVTLVAGAVSVLRADSARIETIGSFTDFHDFAGITIVDSAKFGGTGLLPPGLAVPTVVLGTRQIVGAHNGNLIVEGTLDVGSGLAAVSGTLLMRGAGRLRMTDNADTLSVGGAVDFSGGNTIGDLTDGVLRLAGDFTSAPSAFVAAPAHITSFIGASPATLTLEGSGFSGGLSRFGTLSLAKSGLAALTTASPLFVDGQLRTADFGQRLIGTGAAHIATARGADITRLRLTNQPLRIVDGAAVTRLDSLRFENFTDASQPQLYIERDSLEVSVVSPVFDSSATTPVYVELVDATVGPESLTVTVVDPLPAYHLGRITVGSRASLVGWNIFEFLTWTNADGDRVWSNPNNWSPPFPPFGGDSVVISGAAPPIITAPASVRSLVSTASAAIEINDVLEVSRVFRLGTSAGATCAGAGVLAKSSADSLVMDGAINCLVAVTAGNTSLSAGATLDSLSIGGTGVVDPNGNTLTVNGAMRTSGSGTLAMNSGTDVVVVGGAAEFASTPSAGALTAGTLELRGSFSQITSATAFQADSGHATVFAGNVNQRAAFANPDSSAAGSHFGRLIFGQTEAGVAVELDSDVFAVGVVTGSGLASTRAARAFGVATRTLTAAGANIFSDIDLNLDNVALRIVDVTGALGAQHSVRFSNMGDNVTQLEIHSIGGTVGLNFFEFDSTAVNTVYLRALDVDGATNGLLELATSGTTPVFNFGRISEDGGASITGWPFEPSFIWTGANSNVWTDVGNWSDGVVPGVGSAIEIPTTATPPSGIPAGTYGGLEVTETSAAININGVVTFTGNVFVPLGIERGLACGSSDTLVVSTTFGAGLSGTIGCPVTITSGETGVNNTLNVNALTVTGGEFDVGDFTTTVVNSFRTSGSGTLRMQIPTGALSVQGSATFGGGSTSGLLTDGTLTARSGFSVTSDSGFVAGGNHRTVLGGNFALDFYTFALPATLGHRFGILELAPQSLQHAVGPAHRIVADSLFMPSGGTLSMDGVGDEVRVLGSVRTASTAGIDAVRLEVGGHYSYPGTTVIDTVVFTGIGQRLPFSSDTGVVHSFQDVIIEGTVQTLATAGDSLVVPNVINVRGSGSLRFGQDGGVQTRARMGVLRTVQDGVVSMQNAGDSVHVSLEANFAGGSTAGLLTNGTLIVGSTLSQLAIASPESFSASADHLTIVRPSSFAELYFMNPGSGAGTSGIASLRIEEDNLAIDTVFFRSDVHVRGMLLDAPTDTMVLASNDATQRTLESWGADVGGLRFSRVNWRITGQAAFTAADDLLFTDQDSSAIQLELRGTDNTVSMSDVTFFVPPSTGSYLRLEDTNGGAPFTLNTSNWSPGFHGGARTLVGGAVLNGWAEFPAFTWVGGTSTSFADSTNWLLNRIPGVGDSIVVTPGASNTLTITGERSLGSLYLASGAALSVQDTLIVAGSFNTELGSLSCVLGNNAIRIQNPSGTPRDLSLAGTDCNVFVEQGEYALQGASASARNFTVSGTGYLNLNNRRLETTDNFGTLNTGRIEMNEPNDSLIVGGQAFFQGGSTAGLITDGFIYVRNTFAQGGVPSAFQASGSNRAVIGDTLVAFTDSVDFSFNNPDSSWFNNVRVFNGPWTIDNAVRARVLTTVGTASLFGGTIQTDSSLSFSSGTTVALRSITTLGNFFPSNSFAVDTMNFMGSLIDPEQVIPALASGSTYRTINVYNDARIQSAFPQIFRVANRLEVFNGQLNVRSSGEGPLGDVRIAADTADLIIGGSGRLAMRTTGTVSVDSAHFGGLSTLGHLQAGRLQIRGALVQRSDVSGESFRPDSALITVFRDSVLVDIQDTVNSRTADVELGDSLVMTLRSNLEIAGTLTRQAGISDSVVITSNLLTGAPRRLLVTGATMLDQSGTERTVLRNVALAMIQNSAVTPTSAELNNVSFTNMDAEATQLDLTQYLGYTSAFSRIDFATPVTTGKYFDLAATSLVTFNTTTPSVGCINAPEGCFGPRSEPTATLENVWTGATGIDWTTTTNWSLGRAPLSYDDVRIPVTGNAPSLLAGPVRVRNLAVETGASMSLDGVEFEVTGNLNVQGSILPGTTSGALLLKPGGNGQTIGGGGTIALNTELAAPVNAADSVITMAGPLNIDGRLLVKAGRLVMNGNWLTVDSLATDSAGTLTMNLPADSLNVAGAARFSGGSSVGLLTDGVLVLQAGGQFSQTSGATFVADAQHRTIVAGDGVSLAMSDASVSHFGTLVVTGGTGFVMGGDVSVAARTQIANRGAYSVSSNNIGSNNWRLRTGGIIDPSTFLTFNNISLEITDALPWTPNNAITFASMSPSADQYTVYRTGGTIALPGLTFTPLGISDPGRYLVVADTVDDSDNFVAQVGGVSPSAHEGHVASIVYASFTGWDEFPLYVFTGASSGNFNDAGNWSVNAVPTATSAIQVSASAATAMTVSSPVTVRSFATEAGSIPVVVTAPLSVRDNIDLQTSPSCSGAGELREVDFGSSQISGNASGCLVRVTVGAQSAGSVTFGSLVVEGSLYVGTGFPANGVTVLDSLRAVGGFLIMSEPSGWPTDTLTVRGTARFGSTIDSTRFYNARVNFEGDVILDGLFSIESGAHAYFGSPTGPVNTSVRTIAPTDDFDSVTVLNGQLTIVDSLRVRTLMDAGTDSTVTVTGGALLIGNKSEGVDGLLNFVGETADLTVNRLQTYGFFQAAGAFAVDTVDFVGRNASAQAIPGAVGGPGSANYVYKTVRVFANAFMDDRESFGDEAYTIHQGLEVHRGALLSINATTGDSLIIAMDSAYFSVVGDSATSVQVQGSLVRLRVDSMFLSTSDANFFSNGSVLEVMSDLIVEPITGNLAIFVPVTGNHTTRLLGSGTIDLGNTVGNSAFSRLEVAPATTVTFRSEIFVSDVLTRTPLSTGTLNFQSDNLADGFTRRLNLRGVDLPQASGNTLFRNVNVSFNADFLGGSPTMVFDNVTFQDMGTVDYLLADVDGPATLTFNNVSFDSPLLGANSYFNFSNFGAGSGTATIEFVNAFPNIDCFVTVCNRGDVVPTGAGGVLMTWDGDVSSDWNDPANWDTNEVPIFTTLVLIPDANLTNFDPVLDATLSISQLTVGSGGLLTVNSGDTLNVFGSIEVLGSVQGSNYTSALRMRVGSAGAGILAQSPGVLRIPLLIDRGIGSDTGTVTLQTNVFVDTIPGVFGSFNGGVRVRAGTLHMNQQDLVTNGSFRTLGAGQLRMDMSADSLYAFWQLEFGGASTDGLITDGVIVTRNSFIQDSLTSRRSFVATGSNRVVLLGGEYDSDIAFKSGGATDSRFANLTFDKQFPRTVNFYSGSGNSTTYAQTLDHISGGVILDGGALVVSGAVSQAPTDSTWFIYDEASFVNLQGVSPLTCDGLSFTVENLPQLFQPSSCYTVPASSTWDGSSGTDWFDSNNWSDGVPSAVTSAIIPAAAFNPPTVGFSTLVGGLTVESGATLNINSFRSLTVFGSVDVAGTVNAGDLSSALIMRSTSAETRTLAATGAIATRLDIDAGLNGDEGTIQLAGRVNLTATSFQSGLNLNAGSLDLNGHTLDVQGSFVTSGTSTFRMNNPNDSLFVDQNFEVAGGSTLGLLTAGEIVVSGVYFRQYDTNSSTSFAATGSHSVRLAGGALGMDVWFDSPDSTLSRFANLAFDRDGTQYLYLDYSPVFATNLTRVDGYIEVFSDGDLIVTGTVSNVDPGHLFSVYSGTFVDFLGVDPQTCDGLTFNVEIALANFRPTSCHSPSYQFVAETGTASVRTNGMFAASNTEIWAVGDSGTVQFGNGNPNAWFVETSSVTDDLYSVHGTSATDVWAVGANGSIIHWDGSIWSASTSGTLVTLRGVFAVSPTSVFAVGDGGTILEYNGTSWSAVTSSTTENLYAVYKDPLRDMIASGANGTALRLSGGTWSTTVTSTTALLAATWTSPEPEYYVVGAGGVISLRYNFFGFSYFAGASPTANNLNAFSGFGSTAFIAGDNGTILQKLGEGFVVVTSPTSENLRSVAVTPDGTAYVGGTNGVILKGTVIP